MIKKQKPRSDPKIRFNKGKLSYESNYELTTHRGDSKKLLKILQDIVSVAKKYGVRIEITDITSAGFTIIHRCPNINTVWEFSQEKAILLGCAKVVKSGGE